MLQENQLNSNNKSAGIKFVITNDLMHNFAHLDKHQNENIHSSKHYSHFHNSDFHDANLDSFNGRWSKEEHRRFVEAIIIYGNDWKKIQAYIGTRTGTQARSHAQKFLLKHRNNPIFKKKNIDLTLSWTKVIQVIKRNFTLEEFKLAVLSNNGKKRFKKGNIKKLETKEITNNLNESFNYSLNENNNSNELSEDNSQEEVPISLESEIPSTPIIIENKVENQNEESKTVLSFSTDDDPHSQENKSSFEENKSSPLESSEDDEWESPKSIGNFEDNLYIKNFMQAFNKTHNDFNDDDDYNNEFNSVYYTKNEPKYFE